MAFGLSGSDSTFSMLNADPTVAYFTQEGPKAMDYTINGYSLVCDL